MNILNKIKIYMQWGLSNSFTVCELIKLIAMCFTNVPSDLPYSTVKIAALLALLDVHNDYSCG